MQLQGNRSNNNVHTKGNPFNDTIIKFEIKSLEKRKGTSEKGRDGGGEGERGKPELKLKGRSPVIGK